MFHTVIEVASGTATTKLTVCTLLHSSPVSDTQDGIATAVPVGISNRLDASWNIELYQTGVTSYDAVCKNLV